MDKKIKGFTLAELLVVVAIIAVLVAISIPIFTSQLHKAQVATDQTNRRAYYAEIQADYLQKDKYNNLVPKIDYGTNRNKTIYHLDETTTELKAGFYAVDKLSSGAYHISYYCDDYMKESHRDCMIVIG